MYSGDLAAALVLRLAPVGVVRGLGERGGVGFLVRHHRAVHANDPLVARLVLEAGDRDAACALARDVGSRDHQDRELAARLLALDDPEVNAALFAYGGRWARWAVVKQFRYGDGDGPVPLASALRKHFLDREDDLVHALEAADGEVARHAFARIGRGVSQVQRDRALRRSPSMPPWPRDELTALVRRVSDSRGEAMAAFAEAAVLPGSLGAVTLPPRGGNRGAPARVSPPRWRVVRAVGQALADGGMSGAEVLATARPAAYAILALDGGWVSGVRGQVAARAGLRALAAERLGGDPEAWSAVVARIGAGFRGTVPELLTGLDIGGELPCENPLFVAEVLHRLFRMLGMREAERWAYARLLGPDRELAGLGQGRQARDLRRAITRDELCSGEPRTRQRAGPGEEFAERRLIGPFDPTHVLTAPFPERLLRCNDDMERFGSRLLPHVQTFRLAAEALHAGLGSDLDAWTVALHLVRTDFTGSVDDLVETAAAIAA